MKTNNNNGITLLEILLAISLFPLVLFAGSGICLSGLNLANDTQFSAQAQRNAQVLMMHIEKYIKKSAMRFPTEPTSAFNFLIHNSDFSTRSVTYAFSSNSVTFSDSGRTISFPHINSCQFKGGDDGISLDIEIKASDNRDSIKNTYVLNSTIESREVGI